jgi:hypothetical protein
MTEQTCIFMQADRESGWHGWLPVSGRPVTLCAPFGGESGILLRTLIEAEQISVQAVVSQGWTGG